MNKKTLNKIIIKIQIFKDFSQFRELLFLVLDNLFGEIQ